MKPGHAEEPPARAAGPRRPGLLARVARLLRDDRGVIAMKFALMVPGVAVLGLGAVDLHAVYSDRQRMQDIADGAALAGARELGLAVDASGPEARARAFVDAQLAQWAHGPEIAAEVGAITLDDGQRGLRVSLSGNRPSFFGNLLPPGGWNLSARSTATSVAVTPLCVLAHGESGQGVINVRDTSRVRAPACLIHSNRDIDVTGGRIEAAMTQAVTSARGNIFPAPATGAVEVQDPFAGLAIVDDRGRVPGLVDCVLGVIPRVYFTGRHRLRSGVHCGGIDVRGNAELMLDPGEHWFLAGELVARGMGRITGSDVVLFFGDNARFNFNGQATVDLNGRRSGRFAGMVLVGLRQNTLDFTIAADHVRNLHGVIYIPDSRLVIEGQRDVGQDSAWTVIVARELRMNGAPRLVINADYAASDIPVPEGVGPRQGGSRLMQ